MAGRPLRRARRNAQLTASQMEEENQALSRSYADYAVQQRHAVKAYADALRTDLNPLASSAEIRRARAIMKKLEAEYGFNAREFIAAARVNAGMRRTIRRNRDEMAEFEQFIAETGLIPV